MTRRHLWLIILLGSALWAAAAAAAQTPNPLPPTPTPAERAQAEALWRPLEPADAECSGANLLANPSFEGPYSAWTPPGGGHPDCPWGICMSAQMASGWTPFWRSHNPADPGHIYLMPEWKAALSIFTNPVRVRSGERAQQWFTFYATHDAGIYQRVTGVTPGVDYCLSVWGHAWSNNTDHTYTNPADHGFLRQWIGIDPTGGTDYRSPAIVWTPPALQYDTYGLFKLPAVRAQSSALTVFFRSEPQWAYKHNDVYWDDAKLSVAGGVEPPSLRVEPLELTIAARDDQPGVQSATAQVRLLNATGLTWSAVVEPGGDFTPTLSPATAGPGVTPLVLSVDTAGMAPGAYTARVRVQASNPAISGGTQIITLRLTVQSVLPRMSASPTWFNFNATAGSADPQTGLVDLTLRNADHLTWYAFVEPQSDFFPTLTPHHGRAWEDLQIAAPMRELPPGFYRAYVRLRAGHPPITGGDVLITVQLQVGQPSRPVILLADQTAHWMATPAQPLNRQLTYPVTLAGPPGRTWSTLLDPANAFSPVLISGSGGSGDALRLGVSSAGLPLGRHTARVRLTVNDAAFIDPPTVVTVQIDVVEQIHRAWLPILGR